MACGIINTDGDSNITQIPANTLDTVLFTTPPAVTGNEIYMAYITVGPGNYQPNTTSGFAQEERSPLKYILGPAIDFKWDNPDLNDPLRVHWSWVQMEIQ